MCILMSFRLFYDAILLYILLYIYSAHCTYLLHSGRILTSLRLVLLVNMTRNKAKLILSHLYLRPRPRPRPPSPVPRLRLRLRLRPRPPSPVSVSVSAVSIAGPVNVESPGTSGSSAHVINILRLRSNDRHFADEIFKCVSLNTNHSILI